MKYFKVFCADCKVEYEQKSEKNPSCCGCCGSTWIAVKEIEVDNRWVNNIWCSRGKNHFEDPPAEEISCDCLERMEEMEILRDLDREPEEINEL